MESETFTNLFYIFVFFPITLLTLVSNWKVYSKAGKSGWASLIPFYNLYILLKITGRSSWWILLMFFPLVNIFVWLVISVDLARVFGKKFWFGFLALWLFPFAGLPILAFGKAQYNLNPAPITSSAPYDRSRNLV